MKITVHALIVFLILMVPVISYAQPDPPDSHGESTNQNSGGGAPVGSGLFILLGMGSVYAAYKHFSNSKEDMED